MAKYRNEDQLALARRLMALGCPLDLQFLQQAGNGSSRGLRIRQVGGYIENQVFDIESSWAGCILDLEIVNDLGRAIYLRGFELELPLRDPLFCWLPDPQQGNGELELYRFAGGKLEYPRGIVINRMIQSTTKFRNGDLVAGLVLGQSSQGISDCYKHGEELHAKFSVIDQFDGRHSADVVLYCDRSAQLRPRRPQKLRRSIFHPSQLVRVGARNYEVKRKRYSREFQLMAVERMKIGNNIVELAQELSVTRRCLYKWRTKLDWVERGRKLHGRTRVNRRSAGKSSS